MTTQKNTKQEYVTFKEAATPRNQLELPTLRFIVMDQWIDVIGEKAFLAWLKMYTWCKRDEPKEQADLWNQSKIPTSFNSIIKRLKVGRTTFYNQILKPLWNVGLIDIEEYEESNNKGTKPMNIIVFKYPQNNIRLSYQPLEKIRDYDEDYHSKARTFANLRGKNQGKNVASIGCTESVQGVSQMSTGGCPESVQGGYQTSTGGRPEPGHNNNLNSISNNLNILNNSLNNISNLSIYKEINDLQCAELIKNVLHKKMDRLIADHIDLKIFEELWEMEVNKENGLSDVEFADMLTIALEEAKKPIGSKGSPKNFFRTAIERYRNRSSHKNVVPQKKRVEIIPDWLEENKTEDATDPYSKMGLQELQEQKQSIESILHKNARLNAEQIQSLEVMMDKVNHYLSLKEA